MNLTGDSLEIPSLADLPGSNQGLMRVMANDGFHTAQDDSDGVFTVPDSPPLAIILQPMDGTVVESGSLLVLYGTASDTKDGPLSGTQLTWRSNRDGNLGSGEELPINSLSLGQHLITLTATDSDGNSATATVHVLVKYKTFLPVVLRNY